MRNYLKVGNAHKLFDVNITRSELASLALSLYIRAWRCLSGYYALYCTKDLDYTVLYLYIVTFNSCSYRLLDPFPETFNFNHHFHIVNLPYSDRTCTSWLIM